MKPACRYPTERFEAACSRDLSYTPSLSLKNITTILENGQDKVMTRHADVKASGQYDVTFEAFYFKGDDR